MQTPNYRFNSRRYKLHERRVEERNNRIHLFCLLNELHERNFKYVVRAIEYFTINNWENLDKEIHNVLELFGFLKILKETLAEPGIDIKFDKEWEWNEYTQYTRAHIFKALSPQAQKILKDKNIQI